MKTILVSLISEQTIPNVLLIKELKDIDQHIFITTSKMEDEKKCRSDWIIKAVNLESKQVQRIIVNQDLLADIENQLATQVRKDETNFIVNLTGGNKLMSLAAYNFFSQYQDSKIFYIPVGPKMISYEGIFPNEIRKKYELKYRVNLLEYLASYGVNPKTKETNKLFKSVSYTRDFYNTYRLSREQSMVPDKLRPFRKKGTNISKVEGLEKWLETMKFMPSELGKLSKYEAKYLSGDWFEEYVYFLIKDFLSLEDSYIWTGISVDINGQENELDVLFIYNNKLYLVECKTSIFDGKTERSIFTETAYKIAALRREFGLNVETMIFTLTARGKEKNHVREIDIDRAGLLGIRRIFDGDLLGDDQELKESLRKVFS